MSLKFNGDGKFKIVQFTDMHFGDDKEEDRISDGKTADLVQRIIASEKPDLIVLTGDMIWSHGVPDPKASFRRALAPVVASGLPWAAVFGNHDAEARVTHEELLAIQQENDKCLSVAGPADIHGTGNYVLTVQGSEGEAAVAAALYFFDSGINAPEPIGGYAWIHTDQVNWYTQQARQLAERAGTGIGPEARAATGSAAVEGLEIVEGPAATVRLATTAGSGTVEGPAAVEGPETTAGSGPAVDVGAVSVGVSGAVSEAVSVAVSKAVSAAPLPALAFFHIPVPEYDEVWEAGLATGTKEERVECPKINTGLFGAMVQMGDVMGTFVGHDHDNDYCGTLHGIRLCYGRVTGYNCYGKLQRGARVIQLTEGLRDFETWIVEADGGIVR